MSSVGRTIARNTKWNVAARLWEAVASILLMRYIAEQFENAFAALGLWFLVRRAVGYAALLDVGVSSSFTKFIAEFAAREDDGRLSSVVSAGVVFYAAFGALVMAVGWPLAAPGVDAAQGAGWLDAVARADVLFLLRWSLVLYAASGLVGAFSAVMTGMQRMDLSARWGALVSLVNIAATVGFLETGHGVRGLLYASAVSTAFFAVASVATAFWLVPGLRVSPLRLRGATFRRMLGYGWRTQVARLGNLVMLETDPIVISLFGLGLVPPYEFGVSFANKLRQAPAMLVSALLPAASDLDARDDKDRLRRLYLRSSKYVAMVAVPMLALAFGAADLIMHTWMGDKPQLDVAAWVLRIMTIAFVANTIPAAGVAVVLGMGRADLQMGAGLICTVGNVVLTVVLYLTVGFWGIPIATALAMYIGWLWFNNAVRHVLDVAPLTFLRETLLWPALASVPWLGVSILWNAWAAGPGGSLVNGPHLLGCSALFVLGYALLLRWTPCLDTFDVEFLEEHLYLRRVPGFAWWTRRARRV